MISEALRAAGVLPDRSIPGEGLVYKLFDTIGETLPSMLLTRQAARMASGWDRATVQEAGKQAADRLIDEVQPFARLLIDAAPGGRPACGHGHHLALRPGQAAGRRASASTT